MTKFKKAKAEAAHQMKMEIIARQNKVSDLREEFAAEAKKLGMTAPAMNENMNRLNGLRQWACRQHGSQQYGDLPFFMHPVEVELTVREFFPRGPVYLREAAMIHDTFEDTDATPQQALDAGFHPKAVSIALAVTNPKIEDSDEQLRVLFQQILAEGVGAVIVKGCDRVTNMRNGTRTQNWRKFIKYVNQHPKFEGALWDVAHRPTALMWHEMRELVRIHGPTARKALAA